MNNLKPGKMTDPKDIFTANEYDRITQISRGGAWDDVGVIYRMLKKKILSDIENLRFLDKMQVKQIYEMAKECAIKEKAPADEVKNQIKEAHDATQEILGIKSDGL